jgi:hypothetical protein
LTNSYSLNVLDEFTLSGGQDFYLKLNVYDQSGGIVNLTNYTSTLKIAAFGEQFTILTTITGIIGTNSITYIIPSATSATWLNKKYIYQPTIINTTTSKHYIPKQGCFVVVQEN